MNTSNWRTPYHQLAAAYERLLEEGKALPFGGFPPAPRAAPPPGAPTALFFAPHPDDECIVGGLALRLMRETGMRVLNVAVTLGSNPQRQAERFSELQNACEYLGLGLVSTGPKGLEKISPKTRRADPGHWSECVRVIQSILEQYQPRVILFPHEHDWNSTHIGVHFLLMDALRQMPAGFECYLAETEFWGAMTDPNLMVEISAEVLGDMMAATTFHVGEVRRNPYHVLLPPWLMDNVRRGAEIVGGQGHGAPDFVFAALYRLRKWTGGMPTRFFDGGKFVGRGAGIGEIVGS